MGKRRKRTKKYAEQEAQVRTGQKGNKITEVQKRFMVPDWLFGILAIILVFLLSGVYHFHSTRNLHKVIWVGLGCWCLLGVIVALRLRNGVIADEQASKQRQSKGIAPEQSRSPRLEQPTFQEKVEEFTVWLGGRGMGAGYTVSELEKGPKEPFNLAGFKPVRMYVDNGELRADFTLYGGMGRPPVEIRGNEFIARPSGWDRNSSSAALEIVNENQFPIVQFIYRIPSEIVINGIFPFPGGVILANEKEAIVARGPTTLSFSINRIFKYPSWKHPGEYETKPVRMTTQVAVIRYAPK